MQLIKNPKGMAAQCLKLRLKGKSIGLVPTLGYLHEGHSALIKRAKKENDIVVVSRFINPAQFKKKAYLAYPRDEKRDVAICKGLKVDYLFSPGEKDIYPDGYDTWVEVKELAGRLEGSIIRWHYRAVTTIVAKLFNIALPNKAYFGMKDHHQLILIKRMTADLNFPVKIVGVATKRGKDGVPLSSRLSLLDDDGMRTAKTVTGSVKVIASRIKLGQTKRSALCKELIKMIEAEPMAKVDFVAIVDADTLQEDVIGKKTLIYAAVYIGDVRVTDNLIV